MLFPHAPTARTAATVPYLRLRDIRVANAEAGVIEDAKFKRQDALADLAKAATKK